MRCLFPSWPASALPALGGNREVDLVGFEFVVAHEVKAELQPDLKLTELSFPDEPSNLGDFKPVEPLERLSGSRDGVMNGLLYRDRKSVV